MFSEFEVVNVFSRYKDDPHTPVKCYTIAEKDYIIHTFDSANTKIRSHRPNWVEYVTFVSFTLDAIEFAP